MATRRVPRPASTPLPQRVLRNEVSRVLRDAEAGERFAITVNGRVVAELGPPASRREGAPPASLRDVVDRCRGRSDPDFWNDVRSITRHPENVEDPWDAHAADT